MSDLEFVMEPKAEPSEAERESEQRLRIERCIPVAKKLLKMLFEDVDSLAMGENAEVKAAVSPIAEKVLALFLQEDIVWTDRQFIVQLALQPMAHLNEALENALSISWDRALTQLWGKDAIDLKISEVHNVLTQIKPKE